MPRVIGHFSVGSQSPALHAELRKEEPARRHLTLVSSGDPVNRHMATECFIGASRVYAAGAIEAHGSFILAAPEELQTPLLAAETAAQKFARLAAQWRRDTARLSVLFKKVTHSAYQRIIGMGPAAIPFILTELQKEDDHWFWALESITEESPCPSTASFREAADAWIRWGREHGQIKG